jgi:hypothetical protein
MSNDNRTPDLIGRAERRIRRAVATAGSVAVSDLRPMWPVSRPLLSAVLRRMVDDGVLIRASGPRPCGPPRFVARDPARPAGPAEARR